MTIRAGALIDVGDFTDSGWLPITLAAGITNLSGYNLSYRRIGIGAVTIVFLRGRVTGLVAATQTTITAAGSELPVGSRPGVPTLDLGIIGNGTSTKARVFVQSSGAIGGRTDAGVDLFVFGSFIADA